MQKGFKKNSKLIMATYIYSNYSCGIFVIIENFITMMMS